MFWFRVQIECRLIHLHTRHIMTRIRRHGSGTNTTVPKIWRPLNHILLVRKSGDEIIIIIKMADDWRRPSINDCWWFYGWERWPDNGFISVSENKQDYFFPSLTLIFMIISRLDQALNDLHASSGHNRNEREVRRRKKKVMMTIMMTTDWRLVANSATNHFLFPKNKKKWITTCKWVHQWRQCNTRALDECSK